MVFSLLSPEPMASALAVNAAGQDDDDKIDTWELTGNRVNMPCFTRATGEQKDRAMSTPRHKRVKVPFWTTVLFSKC